MCIFQGSSNTQILLLPVNSGKKVGRVLPGQANSDHVVTWVSCFRLAPADKETC